MLNSKNMALNPITTILFLLRHQVLRKWGYRRLLAASVENNLKNICLNFLEIISLVCLISGKLKT
jgi:hypothetical protein